MKVRIKKLSEDAVIPRYAKDGDAGLDLIALAVTQYVPKQGNIGGDRFEYSTGLAIEIPEGYCGLILPRSSIRDRDMMLCNPPGLIDSGYRGEIKVTFWGGGEIYRPGDKVAQLLIVPYPKIELEEVIEGELAVSERGEGGHGSTGN